MTAREHLRIFRRGAEYSLRVNRKYTVLLMANAVLSSVTGYVPIYFSARVIDALIAGAPVRTVLFYAALTVGIVFAANLLCTYLACEKEAARKGVWRNEEWSYSEKAMGMAYESMEDPEVDRLRYRIRRESQIGQNLFLFYQHIERLTCQAARIAASLALTASFFTLPSVPLGLKLAIGTGVAAAMLLQTLATQKINRLDRDFNASSVEINILFEHFDDYIAHYGAGKDVRLYGMGGFLRDSLLAADREYWERDLKVSCRKALWTLPAAVLNAGLKFGVYAVLLYAAMRGGVTAGSIAKYVTCVMLLAEALVRMTETLQEALDNNHYLKRYFSYFDIPNRMYQGSLTVEKRDDNEYEVEFRNVSFRYPGTKGYALKDVSLKFQVGERLAIVGMNGSGKTTFIKLLCRLYDPTEGEILLNGVNIQKYDYDEYMSIFSVVFQDFSLFALKLGEVVAAGREFEEARVRECLEKANFGQRLAALPKGVHTYLYKSYDPEGVEISGGEGQKIALARALYKDAPFILLDEPTAALDPVSEYEVYSNFNRISGEKTAVYISHRLASCRFCDRIAVFHRGRIIQQGSHEELLADRAGKYCELWNAQAQYYITS